MAGIRVACTRVGTWPSPAARRGAEGHARLCPRCRGLAEALAGRQTARWLMLGGPRPLTAGVGTTVPAMLPSSAVPPCMAPPPSRVPSKGRGLGRPRAGLRWAAPS